jgi:hypothetical protein
MLLQYVNSINWMVTLGVGCIGGRVYYMDNLVLIVCLVLVLHYSGRICLDRCKAKAIGGQCYLEFCFYFFWH